MKNIQHLSSHNYNVRQETYSGKNRAPKSSQSESSQKIILLNEVKSSSSNKESSFSRKSLASSSSASKFTTGNSSTSYSSKLGGHGTLSIHSDSIERTKDFRSESYSGSYSREQSCKKNEVDYLLSRSQRNLQALPLIPRMAKKWCNYPYACPGASRVGKTFPKSSHSLEIVRGWKEEGCGVACVAMVTGRDYKECRDQAMAVGGYNPCRGMELAGVCQTLQSLGVNAHMKPFGTWDDLPDLAIVAVWVKKRGHAAVFKRKNGIGYIFDRNATVPLSPERFKLADNQCISISKDVKPPPPAPKPVPPKPVPPAPPEPSWGRSIIDRIDKELDEAFGVVDDAMRQCFEAIDKAKHKYIDINRKFLDFLEKL